MYEVEANPPSNVPRDAGYPGYPAGFPATCSASNGSAAITSAPLAYFQYGLISTLPTEYVISPTGFFFENQNYANVPPAASWSYPAISAWGVSEPSEPLPIKGIATANYVGFLFETTLGNSTYHTQLVGFGNVPISGTVMTGGVFPNEDPTQVPIRDMSITFNSQDPLNNGVFYLAKLTTSPDNPTPSVCAQLGVSPSGTPTCINDAVAMVGYLNGQYAIILSATDPSSDQEMLVLFQQ